MKFVSFVVIAAIAAVAGAQERPNILWLSSEDNGPHIGAYGDTFADTPNLDALAAKGMIYLNAWSNAPVCAPARTTIISGMYPTSTGSEHMRSDIPAPEGTRFFPALLREAGYYCTNNRKTDYNLIPNGDVWDESSNTAHWKNRNEGQPFFAVFNFTTTHESQIRKRPHEAVHDPAGVRVPAYHPDTPEVRQDWAQYYDKMTAMDAQVGDALKELEEAGLADDTIVMYWGDHGIGLPRGKRFAGNSGLSVPLIVHIPEKFNSLASDYKTGGETERLVGFIDLAPTVLSLAGVEAPKYFEGAAFMGAHEAEPKDYLYGYRGRMDERYDLVRSARDKQYVYIRNFMPHRPHGQHCEYMFQTPTTQVWHRLYTEGKLNDAQAAFWKEKAPEELYDLNADPDEVRNLAGSEDHRETLVRLRNALRTHILETRDVGLLPEPDMHVRAEGTTPYAVGHSPDYPLATILETAEWASDRNPARTSNLVSRLGHEDAAVRYWAATGLLIRGEDAVTDHISELTALFQDPSPSVRVPAAEAVARYGVSKAVNFAAGTLLRLATLNDHDVYTVMLALNAIDELDERAAVIREYLEDYPLDNGDVPKRIKGKVQRLVDKTFADLDATEEGDE